MCAPPGVAGDGAGVGRRRAACFAEWMAVDPGVVDTRIERIGRFPFRARFHLRAQELAYLARTGVDAMPQHARDLVTARVAPAHPAKDGKQTPWGGHPVFRAQHATGTCCRGCLEKNHGIRRGHALSQRELDYVVAVICRWIELDLARSRGGAPPSEATPRLPGMPG